MQQAKWKTLPREFVNPFAFMLPLGGKTQTEVYRFAELPPGLEGYQPRWEVVDMTLAALKTLQVRVDLMTDFCVLGLLTFCTTNTVGGFRAQLYDVRKKLRFADRPINFANIAGQVRIQAAPFFLREPYHFDAPRSQVLVEMQNLEAVNNPIQLIIYGVAAPFQGRLSNEP